MPRLPTVRLLINTTTAYGRQAIRGVSRYAREHGPWTIVLEPVGFGLPALAPGPASLDGVIARVADPKLLEHARRLGEERGLPMVDVSGSYPDLDCPRVVSNAGSVGERAAEHLLACGFRRLAFCGFAGQGYSKQRQTAFVEALADRGFDCTVYAGDRRNADRLYARELDRLSAWLRRIDEPTGVFACNDWRGLHLIQAAARLGLGVPDPLGVLGVDNDTVACETCPVPLSSIDIGAEAIGYEAARLLDGLMCGNPPPPEPVCIDRAVVEPRRSTEVLVVDDELVREALTHLRAPQGPPRSVAELLERLPISRRPFETRFKRAVGHSPHTELQACRIRLAQRLLRTTELKVGAVAQRCGYRQAHQLCSAFRTHVGESPAAYRRSARAGPDRTD